ncbi:serine/threonine-protein kinase [Streptomyces sp. TLI_55]|uniref:protein kinase domain-containing protein n=1 Tax=Streptomyces sp. TLI_55 TaxID=1938861 RepID=UPI000BCBEECC|nr:protein kinase [Streptomyces sp. TLI_55]SNX55793.1 serine/threonine-protein kinase [Streptomyces sp. TLI_55]
MVIGVGVQELLAGRYQLQELLGRGAMGEVWRASDEVLGRLVAVKLLRAEEAADAERFRLEAQTAARLNHPNVVGMYDFGSHHDQLYLVMELVDGWSLAQERSLRGVLPPTEAAAIAAQAAAGLAAAHQQGVIHRDIKPANLMLATDRTVKVADFGIARFAAADSTLTATGKILGTADYLAPERALGRPAQPASDVYSLGCVLYELLTGRPPFSGGTSLSVVQQHVSAAPPPPSRLRTEIPQPLSDLVLHLLAKDPASRPTAEQAADRLAGQHGTPQPPVPDGTALMPVPPAPPAPAPLPRETRTTTRHSRPRGGRKLASKAVLYGTGLVVFSAAMALGASLNSGDDDPAPTPSPTPTPMAATSAPPADTAPTSTPPSTPTPLPGDDDEERHERPGKHGKGKGRHSDD